MCNDDIRNYNSKISDLGYLTNVRTKYVCQALQGTECKLCIIID